MEKCKMPCLVSQSVCSSRVKYRFSLRNVKNFSESECKGTAFLPTHKIISTFFDKKGEKKQKRQDKRYFFVSQTVKTKLFSTKTLVVKI